MGDIRIFSIKGSIIAEIEGTSIAVEKSLQILIDKNMETLLGVRFLASEYSTGKTHAGRIDSLGIDENDCPVIIEYKRTLNENVINQGLYYLDWLLDHKAEFHNLVRKKYTEKVADNIEWGNPRLLCIAGDFTKYDIHAVAQIQRNIELIRYQRYGQELLLLELVNVTNVQPGEIEKSQGHITKSTYKTFSEILEQADPELHDLYESLKAFMEALGDDVQTRVLKYYIAFKRIKNFACIEIRIQKREIFLYLRVDPGTITLEEGFTRNVRNIGHYGTGDLEVIIRSPYDLVRVKDLIIKSYETS